jgi:hypothetical protein
VILIWGLPTDSPVEAVIDALGEVGEEFLILDQRELLETEMDVVVDDTVRGMLRHGGKKIDLTAVRGMYLRPYELSRLYADAPDHQRMRVTALNEALLAWSEVAPARILNRPSAMASNHSKPYQAALIHAQGFDVPKTLLTTDPEALEAFWALHGTIIYKSTSGIRSIVSRLTPGHREHFANLATCPTQFQEWIDGVDIRVHVVGDEVFASCIESAAADYRYPRTDEEQPRIEAFDLPPNIADRCLSLAEALSLDFAGIDFRLTLDGRWFCFEVNPSPGFSYFEQVTRQPIARSIARLLGCPAARTRLCVPPLLEHDVFRLGHSLNF